MSVFLKIINRKTLNIKNVLKASLKSCSTVPSSILEYDKDPSAKFLDNEIQNVLKSLSRMELEKVFRKRAMSLSQVQYKFMTTEEIEHEVEIAIRRAYALLQMPPIVPIKKDEITIVSKDTALQSFDESNFIFTDITYDLNDSDRTVIIRTTDGMLQNANSEIRKRVNSIYFPLAGREFHTPNMFQTEHLQRCLDQHFYEYILDRACIQFEPFEWDFHRVTSEVYLYVNKMRHFDQLRSTRHFGPMVFFLVWHKMIDHLLIDMIDKDFLKNGIELIYLYNKIHDLDAINHNILKELNVFENNIGVIGRLKTDAVTEDHDRSVGKSSDLLKIDEKCLKLIESFVKDHSVQKSAIEASLQNNRLMHDERMRLSDGLHKAHGLR